jgi:hypothetical protein
VGDRAYRAAKPLGDVFIGFTIAEILMQCPQFFL